MNVAKINSATNSWLQTTYGFSGVLNSTGDPCIHLDDAAAYLTAPQYSVVAWVDYYVNGSLVGLPIAHRKPR